MRERVRVVIEGHLGTCNENLKSIYNIPFILDIVWISLCLRRQFALKEMRSVNLRKNIATLNNVKDVVIH